MIGSETHTVTSIETRQALDPRGLRTPSADRAASRDKPQSEPTDGPFRSAANPYAGTGRSADFRALATAIPAG